MRRIHHYIKQTQPHIRKMNDYNQVHINIYSFFMSSQSPSNSLFTLRFHESLDGLWESCRNAEGAPALSDRKEVTDVACSLQGSGGERRGNRFNQRRHAEITTQPPPFDLHLRHFTRLIVFIKAKRWPEAADAPPPLTAATCAAAELTQQKSSAVNTQ